MTNMNRVVTDSMKESEMSSKSQEIAMMILERQGFRKHSFKMSGGAQEVMEMILRQRLAKRSFYSFRGKQRITLEFKPYRVIAITSNNKPT